MEPPPPPYTEQDPFLQLNVRTQLDWAQMVPYITPQAIPPPTFAALHFLVKLHTEPYAAAKNLTYETNEVFDPSGFLDHIR